MVRKQRGASGPKDAGACAVCGTRDARALVSVALAGGAEATLCGSHELMHRRARGRSRTVAELRASFGERRSVKRRGDGLEVDELAERLSAAFTTERRVSERRT
jgi:hypothetical protein